MSKQDIIIEFDDIKLPGILRVPANTLGLVIFAHGSGSSRFSERNNFVAEILDRAGVATLLFDLLTEEEDEVYENRFDIELITKRLVKATEWVEKQPKLRKFPIGYFGASTGTAAALKAANRLGKKIKAVVSRGGRPDLAIDEIAGASAAISLIIGGLDDEVIKLNKLAYDKISNIKQMEIVPGATHLFEEPGTLKKAAELAKDWFVKYL